MDIRVQSHDKGRSLEGSGVPRDVGAIRTSEKEQLHCTIPGTIPGGPTPKVNVPFPASPRESTCTLAWNTPPEQGPDVKASISKARDWGHSREETVNDSDNVPLMQSQGPGSLQTLLRKIPPSGRHPVSARRVGEASSEPCWLLCVLFLRKVKAEPPTTQPDLRLLGVLAMETPALSPGPGSGWKGRRKQGNYFCEKRAGWGHRKGRGGKQEGGWGGRP